jgi:hypothetical protein
VRYLTTLLIIKFIEHCSQMSACIWKGGGMTLVDKGGKNR